MLQSTIVFLIASLLCFLTYLVLYSLRSRDIHGLSWLLAACILGAAGNAFYGLGRELEPLVAYELANGVYAAASAALFVGYRYLFGRRPHAVVVFSTVVLLTALVAWFHYVADSFGWRSFLVSAFQVGIAAGIAATVLSARRGEHALHYAGVFILGMCAIVAMGHVARVVWLATTPDAPTSLLQPAPLELAFLVVASVALPALAFGGLLVAYRGIVTAAEETARHDFLTGALTRGAFFQLGERQLAYTARTGRPFALFLIDFDNFKPVNDTFGHAAGDRVLVAFAQSARKVLRAIDFLGRLGGDEFVVLMPDTDMAGAEAAAARIKALVELSQDGVHGVTLSMGIVVVQAGDTLALLLERADRALYKAKNAGRNRIVVGAAPDGALCPNSSVPR